MTEPVVVYEPPKAEPVEFTEEQLAAYRKLAEREESLPWEWGDRLLADFPFGEDSANTGSHRAIEELAKRPDVPTDSAKTLLQRRRVARSWPPARRRVRVASYAAHAELGGPPDTAEVRAKVLDELAAKSDNGRVTHRQVRTHRLHGTSTSARPISDAYLAALDKLRPALQSVRWTMEKYRGKDVPKQVREKYASHAETVRAVAEAMDAIAEGEKFDLDTLHEQLNVGVWAK